MKKVSAPATCPKAPAVCVITPSSILPREIERRREDERDDRRYLSKDLRKGGHAHAAINEGEKVVDERAEAAADHGLLGMLAAEQRHLLGVFAQAGEREAEVGLDVLALEIEAGPGGVRSDA